MKPGRGAVAKAGLTARGAQLSRCFFGRTNNLLVHVDLSLNDDSQLGKQARDMCLCCPACFYGEQVPQTRWAGWGTRARFDKQFRTSLEPHLVPMCMCRLDLPATSSFPKHATRSQRQLRLPIRFDVEDHAG